ncbi:MAG TPA: hypothetical protein VD913_06405, partial [bacterium]|nr:hypothetical protein [bacterium]
MPETSLKRKSPVKTFLPALIYCAVLAGILFTALAVRYHFFLKKLNHYKDWAKSPEPEDSEFPKLESRQLANLGFAQTADEHPVSSYIKFPFEKKPGVIRIGTFGDSHTQGVEAAQNHDYPSFLQRHFRKAGYDHVEVINFGVKSYGLYQAALLWRYLGKKYDLDYAVFMVLSFHADRDLTFIEDTDTAVGVHARYVLKENQLELVPVVGDSRQEASLYYFRMFPPLRYIRYDRRAPPLLRALLPEGREWKFNPFYYRLGRPVTQEIIKSYALLFDQIADEAKNVVVIARDEFIGGLAGNTSSPNVYVLRSQMASFLNWGPYLAPKSHQ